MPHDLRLLICEDEFLLAMDLAQQCSMLGATVVGTAASLAEIAEHVRSEPFEANCALLDLLLADGHATQAIPMLQAAGAAVVISSGYRSAEAPPSLAGLPWVEKPFSTEAVVQALCEAVDARSSDQRD